MVSIFTFLLKLMYHGILVYLNESFAPGWGEESTKLMSTSYQQCSEVLHRRFNTIIELSMHGVVVSFDGYHHFMD